MSQTKVQLVNDVSGNSGFGLSSATGVVHLHKASSDSVEGLKITNSTTGTTISDGLSIGLQSDEDVFIHNYENTSMLFGTNDTTRLTIANDGNVGIGDTTPTKPLTVGTTTPVILLDDQNSRTLEVRGPSASHNASLITTSTHALVLGTNNSERMRLHGTGELSLATTSTNLQGGGASDFYFTVLANTGSNHNGIMVSGLANNFAGFTTRPDSNHLYFAGFFLNNAGSGVGNIEVGLSGTSFHTSSDYRLKENVTNISDGITRLKQLLPRRFNWIIDETNTLQDGFLAHEVSSIVPEAISGEKDAVATEDGGQFAKGDPIYQQIDHSKLVPLLTAALQEEIAKREALESRVTTLEAA